MFDKCKKVVVGVGAGLASVAASVPAFADGEFFTVPTLATTNLGTMATAILAALALIWGVRKGVKMINRS
jgi:hypothetical protein